MQTFEIEAVIEKAGIAACARLKGCANAKAMSIAGGIYVAGSVLFEGFVGAIDMADRLYHGVYTFTASDDHEDVPLADFNTLPGIGKTPQAAPACEVETAPSDTTEAENGEE